MLSPPNILLTGINGVGKSTILNLFPGEIILELDDDFNEIFQKSIDISGVKKIKSCILREIDLNEINNNFNSYNGILSITNIICLVVDSTERNLHESQELLLDLRKNVPSANFFIIANFQDRELISWNIDDIEKFLKLRTFEFSAIQDNSEELIRNILKEILESTISKQKEEFIPKEDFSLIWAEIEEAILYESRNEYHKAAKSFSNIALKIKNLKTKNQEIKALHYLCKAWELLELGEVNKNSQKFAEAEVFFNQANEYLSDANLKNLMYANSIFCEVLKLSSQFDELDNVNEKDSYYPKIQDLIKRAIEFYREGEFSKETDWAINTLKKFKKF